MKFSLVADIMYVAMGEHGPIWPDVEKLGEAMKLAKRNGLDAIEMFGFEGRDLDALAAMARETGVEILSFCQKNNTVWGNPEKLDDLTQGFLDSVDAAKKLGAKNLIINDDGYPRNLDRAKVHQAMIDGLKRLAPLAEQAGLTVLAEPVSGNYFRDATEPFEIIKAVGSPNVKLLYDMFHFQAFAGNIANTVKDNLEWIGHVHGAGAPARCELTEGELNYRFLLKVLKDLGYSHYFGLEFMTFTDREEKVRKSAELVHSI